MNSTTYEDVVEVYYSVLAEIILYYALHVRVQQYVRTKNDSIKINIELVFNTSILISERTFSSQ